MFPIFLHRLYSPGQTACDICRKAILALQQTPANKSSGGSSLDPHLPLKWSRSPNSISPSQLNPPAPCVVVIAAQISLLGKKIAESHNSYSAPLETNSDGLPERQRLQIDPRISPENSKGAIDSKSLLKISKLSKVLLTVGWRATRFSFPGLTIEG